jgi:hypothetical protein
MHHFPKIRKVRTSLTTDQVWLLSGQDSLIWLGRQFDFSSMFIEKTNALLGKLPTELLLQIIELLPASSEASLSLSSKVILHKLGTQYLQNIKCVIPAPKSTPLCHRIDTHHPTQQARRKEYELFLILLDRDNPHLLYCHICLQLHNVDLAREAEISTLWKTRDLIFCYATKSFRLHRQKLPITTPTPEIRHCDEMHMVHTHSTYGITFNRARIAMKYYCAGLSYSPLLQQYFSNRWTQHAIYEIGRPWTGDLEYTLRWELTRTARIIAGRLLLRTEHRATSRTAQGVFQDGRAYTLLSICVHWHWHFKSNSEFSAISRLLNAVKAYPEMEVRSEVTPCRFCHTEFEARGRRLLDGRVVLDFVVWQDLGGLEV